MAKGIEIFRESPLKIRDITKAHWKAKEPFHLLGEPSTVKSQMIKQSAIEICEEDNILGKENRKFVDWSRTTLDEKNEIYANPANYFIFEDFRAAETDIGEIRLQQMTSDKPFITYKYAMIFSTLSKKDSKGIIFFDEMNLANNMIKAQFYKIYNDRAVGDIPISDNILIISAGNESSQVRDVTTDSVALTTRRANYFIKPLDTEEFLNYAVRTGIDESIISYLSFSKEVQDLKFDLNDPIGQPCCRTWEKFSKVIKSNDNFKSEDRSIIARGYLGQGVGLKYMAHYKAGMKIKIDDIIENPAIIKKYEEDPQILYTIISALVGMYTKGRKDIFKSSCEIADQMDREEFAVYLFRMIKNFDNKLFRKLAIDKYEKEFDKSLNRFGKMLEDD